jgi:membrane protein DedA with SNARE-associated domain
MNNITPFLLSHGGTVLFAAVLADQAGLPLPAAPWLLAAGALSATGSLNPALAIALTLLACLLADSAWFFIGRRGRQRVLRLFCRLSLSPNTCVGRTMGLFSTHGAKGLVASKFIPVLGGVMPPLAGALGMGAGKFLLLDTLGSLLYAVAYIAAGIAFHNQISQLGSLLHRLGFSAFLLLLALAPAYIAFKYVRRRRGANAPPARASVSGRDHLHTPSENASRSPVPGLATDLGPAALANLSLALTSASAHAGQPVQTL